MSTTQSSDFEDDSPAEPAPPPQRKNTAQIAKNPRHKKTQPITIDPQIRKIAHQILSNNDYTNVTKQNAQQIISELQKVQTAFQNKSQYSQAEKVSNAIDQLKAFTTSSKFAELQNQRVANYSDILNTTKNDNIDLKNQWIRLIKNAEDQRDADLSEMQSEFDSQLEQFDTQYDAEPDVRFQKFSSEFLNLKQRQKAMVASKHFLEAKGIKKIADELEKKERQRQQNNWIDYLNTEREALINEQDKKLQTRMKTWEAEINKMKNQYRAEMQHGKRSEEYLAAKINEAISDIDNSNDNSNVTSRSIRQPQSSRSKATTKKPTSTRIIRPLSERELQFQQRKRANYITYTKTFGLHTPRK